MKIICQSVTSVQGTLTRTSAIGAVVKLDMLPYQIKDLFLQIWNDEGDDSIKEWLREEGFDMIKIESLNPTL